MPELQPVFFGFGWKGLDVAGPVVPPAEYARYCRKPVAPIQAHGARRSLPCGEVPYILRQAIANAQVTASLRTLAARPVTAG